MKGANVETSVLVDGAAIDYSGCPVIHRESMRRYFEHRIPPGAGLTLILSGDLRAVCAVDDETFMCIRAIWRWLYNYAPPAAWGSSSKVGAWLDGRNQQVHPTLRPIVNSIATLHTPEDAA